MSSVEVELLLAGAHDLPGLSCQGEASDLHDLLARKLV
jgi:hypothetical protein